MSQLSTSSSVPSELLLHNDDLFVEEINVVDELYFASRVDEDSENSELNVNDPDTPTHFESDESEDEELCNLGLVFENSLYDRNENLRQDSFKKNGCDCKMSDGPCCRSLDWDSIVEFREHCQELSREEMDITIKSELFAHRRTGPNTIGKKHKPKQRERPYQEFFFGGQRICRETFCFLHDISRSKLLAITQSIDKDGLSARVHGNTGKPPKHALSVSDREKMKTFLCKYAKDNALPLPGRLPNYKQSNVLLLPSDTTTEKIYVMYQSLATELSLRPVSLRTFQRTWKELCPHIVVSKPCTDLCEKCQQYAFKISNSGSMDETEKQILLDSYQNPIKHAKEQRDLYRAMVLESKKSYSSLPEEQKKLDNPPCSVEGPYHYSWDYAQQVHYPHHSHQVGPIYFKTPRKVNIFGMCSEGSGKQIFYLTDEEHDHGKGPNSVVSMAHHFFEKYGHGEKMANIHFDNCSGQNKNNIVIWYGLWRVIMGLHQSLSYNMMIAGHTKFEPDWHFGVWKVKWRNSNAETLQEVASTVSSSSRSGHNIPHVVNDSDSPVVFYDWKSFLSLYFKPLKHISKYHHFRMNSNFPGVVEYKEHSSDGFQTINLLRKKESLPNILPPTVPSRGIDVNRQWYLYEQIRQYCLNESNKDLCFPKPVIPKREIDLTNDKNEVCGAFPQKRKDSLLS